tara:strand:+ start:427 stop:873 length:447 start_codon:yes stop_codon:yes gene_type:complete
MKTIFFLAAASAALAACGGAEDTDEAIEPVEAELDSTAMGDISGTYEIAMADGTVILQTINADGTYVETTPGGARTGGGAWRIGDDGQMCFDPEGAPGEECYSGGAPGEDGAFEMTDADGEVQSTVRKLDTESGGEDAPIAAEETPKE